MTIYKKQKQINKYYPNFFIYQAQESDTYLRHKKACICIT